MKYSHKNIKTLDILSSTGFRFRPAYNRVRLRSRFFTLKTTDLEAKMQSMLESEKTKTSCIRFFLFTRLKQ